MPLWTQPVDARDAPEAAFGEVYADPVDLGLLRQLDAAKLA